MKPPALARLQQAIRTGGQLAMAAIMLLTACCAAPPVESPTAGPATATIGPARLGPTYTATPVRSATPTIEPTPTLRPIDPISADDWVRGAADPGVQVLAYSDFQCPYCAGFASVVEELLKLHPDDFQFVFRHFPLVSIHDKAFMAAQAAEAAGAQGQFWSMHDLLFARRPEWVELSGEAFRDWILDQAGGLDLDFERFQDDFLQGTYAPKVEQAYNHALASGIPGTPFIFMNGLWFRLSPTLENMEAAVRLELLARRQYASPPALELDAEALYFARLELPQGVVEIRLFPEVAPRNVSNFIFLAEDGWYDGSPIYDVLPDRLVEAGDPSGTGFGGPGYVLNDEIDNGLTFDQPGMVAMSSSGPNTNGSRFFITLAPLPDLDGTRTIIGRVTRGLDILQNLTARDPLQDLLNPPDATIQHVEIEIR